MRATEHFARLAFLRDHMVHDHAMSEKLRGLTRIAMMRLHGTRHDVHRPVDFDHKGLQEAAS